MAVTDSNPAVPGLSSEIYAALVILLENFGGNIIVPADFDASKKQIMSRKIDEGWAIGMIDATPGSSIPIMQEQLEEQTCDVCRLLDDDISPKKVTYCGTCGAWMCERCQGDLIRRAKAMLLSKVKGRTRADMEHR